MNKIDKKLYNFVALSQKECTNECIVYYTNKQKTLRFFKENDIKILNSLDIINAFAVCFNSEKLIITAKQNFVAFVSSVSSVSTQINVSKKILNVKNNFDVSSSAIAFIDTGVSTHLDFCLGRNRIIKYYNFINNSEEILDDNGHGTFVCGVACGSGILSNKKYSGICPNANIVSLKALDHNGEASGVKILEAMQWIYDNHYKYNIKVVCMSFGSEPLGAADPIVKGAEKLWDEGLIVVCAGGNSGPESQTIKSPGVSKKIITVGGLDDCRDVLGNTDEKKFKIADFSSRGPAYGKIKPDVVAPSVNITSCAKIGYKQMSGTSVATPMIAGLCLIIKEKYPNSTPSQIKKHLLLTAKNLNFSKYAQGYGLAQLKIN